VASIDKDLPMKIRVAALFREMGYTAFSEVDLCTYTYQASYRRKQITDFDVLGIRLDPDLGSEIAVAECKSVEERAMENLLKLHGVSQFFHAAKAYFVQQRIDGNAREVGANLGMVCLDNAELTTLMSSLEVSEDRQVQLEEQMYMARVKLLPRQKKDFQRPTEYLKYDFWTLPDHRNVINLIRLLGHMKTEAKSDELAHVVLAHQLVTALSLSVLRLCGGIVRHGLGEIEDSLLTALLGGSRERRDREALYDQVSKIVAGPSELSIRPDFFGKLAEICGRFINAMAHSYKVVRCLDEMTRRVLLTKYAEVGPALEDIFGDRTVKLGRDAIDFAREVSGVPEDIFRHAFMKDDVANVKAAH